MNGDAREYMSMGQKVAVMIAIKEYLRTRDLTPKNRNEFEAAFYMHAINVGGRKYVIKELEE
jgi:hypothetical protein